MIFRIARHTNQLQNVADFYTNIIGLTQIGDFKNHNNYAGIFIGKKDHSWHLELTSSPDIAHHSTDVDDALVFYPESKSEYDQILSKINDFQLPICTARNPYWKENGITIQDPDGFYVIISHLKC